MTTETIALGAISTMAGFIMSDAMWALLVAQVGTIAIMVVKDRRDIRNREQDRLDRESAAKLARDEIAKVAVAGGERENRIVAEVKEVKSVVVDSLKPLVDPQLGSSADKPMHTVSETTDSNPVPVKPVEP